MKWEKLKDIHNNIDYVESDQQSRRKLWINSDWDTSVFREILNLIENANLIENVEGKIIDDRRNLLYYVPGIQKYGLKDDIIIKKFILNRRYDKLRYHFIKSKAVRSLRIALIMQEINLLTPEPVAVIERRGKFNSLLESYYITRYIDFDYNMLDIVRDDNHPLRKRVVDFLPAIGRDARKMHDAGILHNDFHAGNILIKDIESAPLFYYIDLNRARLKKNLSWKQRIGDFARLNFNDEEKKLFLKHYTPEKYKNLIDRLKKARKRRRRFVKLKRKFKKIFR